MPRSKINDMPKIILLGDKDMGMNNKSLTNSDSDTSLRVSLVRYWGGIDKAFGILESYI